MRYIAIPDDIALTEIDGTPVVQDDKAVVVRFREFVLGRLTDSSFAKDMNAVLSAVQIRDAVQRANGVLAIESADWERLRDAVKSPKDGYNRALAHCLVPFMRAVVDAPDKEPQHD